jgi:hypothetical protein
MGKTSCRVSWNTIMNSMSQGTKFLPASSMILRNAARNGRPMAAMRTVDLIVSMTQSLTVDLLKPCFSSRTKLE